MDCNSDCQSWTIWRICQNNCRTFIIHFQRRRVAQNQGKVFGYQITFNIPDDHRNLETQIFAYLIGQYPHSFLHNLSRKIRRFNNFPLNTFIEGSVMAQWKKKKESMFRDCSSILDILRKTFLGGPQQFVAFPMPVNQTSRQFL